MSEEATTPPPLEVRPHRVAQVLGDECVRCSVASLFGLGREETPHFYQVGPDWFSALRDWAEPRGWRPEIYHASLTPPVEWYLGFGDSAGNRALGHCVLMRLGEVWHDPSGVGVSKFEGWIAFFPPPA
jgi:hypothetical protein